MQIRNYGMRSATGFALVAGLALTAGCPNAELAPIEPCTVSGVVQEVRQNAVDQVDVLFVVDNSGSMEQEQVALARELPRMVRILATGDLDDCGARSDCTPEEAEGDFPPVSDLHLGVVSTDMGSAGQNAPNCEGLGDDGLLRATLANTMECSGVGAPPTVYLQYDPSAANADANSLGQTFGCITQLGIDGCGQEQQLDAMLKAVTPAASGIKFFGGSNGHEDSANKDFLRANSVVAVILVTDEDDCSVPDQNGGLLAGHAMGDFATTPVNLRCGLHSDLLYPTQRYVDGLLALRPDNPELIIFAAITGIPLALEGETAEAILSNPAMEFKADRDPSDLAARPVPSCTFPNPLDANMPQEAFPPRRIVEVAAGFGENGTVQSICQDSFSTALDNIIQKISNQLKGACLPRELNRNNFGVVECDIVEFQPNGETNCDNAKGRSHFEPVRIDEETGATVCKINQVAVSGNLGNCAADPTACLSPNPTSMGTIGWYYDNFSAEVLDACVTFDTPQRITFTSSAAPSQGSTVRFECLQPVFDFGESPRGVEAVALGCQGNASVCTGASTDEYTLFCEDTTNTCQILCESDAQCPNSWTCQMPLEGGTGYCVNPTCPAI